MWYNERHIKLITTLHDLLIKFKNATYMIVYVYIYILCFNIINSIFVMLKLKILYNQLNLLY